MSKVNEMFDKLKTIVPEGINKEQEDKETKVTTLRSAILYISELQTLLTDYDAGALDPTRYQDNTKENMKKTSKSVIGSKKSQKKDKHGRVFKRKNVLKPKKWVDFSRKKLIIKAAANQAVHPNVHNSQSVQNIVQPVLTVQSLMQGQLLNGQSHVQSVPSHVQTVLSNMQSAQSNTHSVQSHVQAVQSHVQTVQSHVQGQVQNVQCVQQVAGKASDISQFVVYEEPAQYVVYQDPLPLSRDYVVYQQKDKEDVCHQDPETYEQEPKDSLGYKETNLHSPKDVNVISLYISLIDGKRCADGKFSSEL